jgi:Putative Ig domain/Ricin-type beta-trefoil lectin domain/Subtilase family
MHASRTLTLAVAAALGLAALSATAATAAAATAAAAAAAHPAASGHDYRRACAATRSGRMSCLVLVRTNVRQRAQATLRRGAEPTGVGYGPQDLQSAYFLPSTSAGAGQTVAIVDAYNDPAAAADLAVYRSDWGLPACTAASGCFRKVSQQGKASPLPAAAGGTGWATEESLDIEMVSAICPQCHILLVEADSTSNADMFAAVDTAVRLGAKFVSNSYGETEYAAEVTDGNPSYNHPGVVVTAAAGDYGYANGAEFPAASPDVVSVGGTTLTQASGARGWAETAWADTGSGCSLYEPKPSWQTDSGCANRTDNDVAAVADPSTGVAIYDTYDQKGWLEVGGTSVASPVIASVYALVGTPPAGSYPASYLYAHTSDLYDVTTGNNGYCSPLYLCYAGPGYDGPTGWGTPDGIKAFGVATGNVITVGNPETQDDTAGVAVSLPIRAADSAAGQTLAFSAAGLPPGLSIGSSTGLISGTPDKVGSYTVTVTATDTTGATGTAVFTLAIASPVTITSTATQDGYLGQPADAAITATDQDSGSTLSYSARGLPAGLSISPATGVITGLPARPGYFRPVVTVTDSAGWAASQTLTWYIGAAQASGRSGPLRLDGRCLDTGLKLARCASGPAQSWTVRPAGTVSSARGCLAVSGSAVRLAACDAAAAAQQWRVGDRGELVSPATGQCLTGGAQVRACVASAKQRWTLPAGPLVSAETGKCAAAVGRSGAESWYCGDTAAQAWTVTDRGTIQVGGRCLTLAAGRLSLAACTAAATQRWRPQADGTLLNPSAGRCLAIPGDSPVAGIRLAARACSPSAADLWHVE